MKMMFNKNIKAVSPVIATILMVAVTVVLAAVLYVMVIGMDPGSTELAPLGSWLEPNPISNSSIIYTFGTFSQKTEVTEAKIIIIQGDNQTYFEFPGRLTNSTTTLTKVGDTSGTLNVVYEDNSFMGNTINQGDKLILTGLSSDTVYEIKLFHKPTNQVMSMTGYSNLFETNP